MPISVTAIMITGKDPARAPLASIAVGAFLAQTYADKRLVIVNTGAAPLLAEAAPGVEERHLPEAASKSLGHLRNLAMRGVKTGYLVQWDDDDFSAPERLHRQVSATPRGSASIFLREIHCCLATGQAFNGCGRESRAGGFAGTMLWPATYTGKFPDLGRHEDTEFLLPLKAEGKLKVLDNDPCLYVRFYHGHNTWEREHVMRRRSGSRDLSPEQWQHLEWVRSHYAEFLRKSDSP